MEVVCRCALKTNSNYHITSLTLKSEHIAASSIAIAHTATESRTSLLGVPPKLNQLIVFGVIGRGSEPPGLEN